MVEVADGGRDGDEEVADGIEGVEGADEDGDGVQAGSGSGRDRVDL